MKQAKHRILIVDDDVDLCRSLSLILGRHGYDVVTADGARRAIEAVEEGDFDLILVDMVMPDMGGLETLKLLREKASRSRMVMMTGFAVSGQVAETIKVGVDGVLFKPFEANLIVNKLMSDDPLELFESYLQTIWSRITPVVGETTAQMVFINAVNNIFPAIENEQQGIEIAEGGVSLQGLRNHLNDVSSEEVLVTKSEQLISDLKRLLGEVFDILGMLTGELLTEPLVEALDKELKSSADRLKDS